jgi:hypothetical protein
LRRGDHEQRVYAISSAPSATTGVVLLLHSEVDRFDELLAAGSRASKPARVEVSDT